MKFIGALAMFLCILPPIWGQALLKYGANLVSKIEQLGEIDEYHFLADSGDVIWIRMRDVNKVDASVKLFDPTGRLVGADDDFGGLAFLKDMTLHQTGLYRITASDRNHNDIGEYGISLHKLNHPQYARHLACATNLTDTIRAHAAVNVYTFEAQAGDVLFTQMRGLTKHLEPEFFMYDTSGHLIFKSARKGRMATHNMRLPANGPYYLFITDRGGNDADIYGFAFQLLNKYSCGHELSCSQTKVDHLAHLAALQAYTLSMNEGEVGLLQLRSPDPTIEASLAIYDSHGDLVIEKTASDRLVDATITNEKDASYLILVFDKHGNDLGSYSLHYQSLTGSNACSQQILCEEINSVEVGIDQLAQVRTFFVNGHESDTFYFELEEISEDLEPHLRMFDELGQMIFERSASSKLNVSGVFPKTGAYCLMVGDKSGNDIGNLRFWSKASQNEVTLPEDFVYHPGDPCLNIAPVFVGQPRHYQWSIGSNEATVQWCPEETSELFLTVTFVNGCQESVSTMLSVQEKNCDTLDFNALMTGEVVSDQFPGVQITAASNQQNGTNLATIFNSTFPPKLSEGLGTPHRDFGGAGIGGGGGAGREGENAYHQKQVLILAKEQVDADGDGLIDQPVDDPKGGQLIFTFDQPTYLQSILVIDQHQDGGNVQTFDNEDQLIARLDFQSLGNNSVETVPIHQDGVKKLKVEFVKWGALDDLVYCPSEMALPQVKNALSNLPVEIESSVQVKSITPQRAIVYPNPSQGIIKIKWLDGKPYRPQLLIYDVTGAQVFVMKLNEVLPVDLAAISLEHLDPGLYFLHISTSRSSELHKVHIVD